MDTVKKVFRFLSSVLFYSVMLILFVVILMFLAYYVDQQIGKKQGQSRSPLFGAYIIISESMIPSINVYDAVLTIRVSKDDIEKYDIITFISKDIETAGTPITHRVIDIVHDPEDENKIIGYRTKGDHNNTADFALIAPDEVLGKVYLRIPMIGYLQTFMTKPIGWLLIVVIPCLLIIGSDILKLLKGNRSAQHNNNNNDNDNIQPENSNINVNIDINNSSETSLKNSAIEHTNDDSTSDSNHEELL